MKSTDALFHNPNPNLTQSKRVLASLLAQELREKIELVNLSNTVQSLRGIRREHGEEFLNEVLYMLYVAADVFKNKRVMDRLDEAQKVEALLKGVEL
jgi:hypothetical protein